MRLLRYSDSGDVILETYRDDDPPPYAILSHTWIKDQEVDFQELASGAGKDKSGYKKIQFCGEQATLDGLEYFWVDTCCIDKTSSQELSTAINSMFRWYQRSSKCYVYLSDVSLSEDVTPSGPSSAAWELAFRESRWFTRGWTLQELLAPTSVEFFSREGKRLGSRTMLTQQIHEITDLPLELLTGQAIADFTVSQRLEWIASRETTLIEDRVYCLLGILQVHLVPIYGEGKEYAHGRLMREIQQLQTTPTIAAGTFMGISTISQQTPARDVMEIEKFLRWLSYPEMDFRYGDIDNAKDDTCKWLLNHAHYEQWRSGDDPRPLLMIHGKPGSGKSTAMKRAYELAQKHASKRTAVAAFFFSSRGFPMQRKLEGFFRSMLHQLFRHHGSTDDEIFVEWQNRQKVNRPGWSWTMQELKWRFRKYVVQSTYSITLFVDALDECDSTDAAHDLMDFLTDIRGCCHVAASRIQICVSSRHYPNVGALEPLHIVVETTNKNDIAKFVEESLKSDTGHVPIQELAQEVSSHSEGMFLWAHLVLRKLRVAFREKEPLNELYAVIGSTPKGLEEVFQELIDGISANERERSNCLLSWILFARRPMYLSELDHAWAFRNAYSTYTQYEESRAFIRPEHVGPLLAKYTRGLAEAVEVGALSDKAEAVPLFRVQFIHESVRQFIFSRRHIITTGLDAAWVDSGFVDHFMAQSCFNYLKAVCAESQVVQVIAGRLDHRDSYYNRGDLCKIQTKARPFLEYALEFGFEHARSAELEGFPPSYLYDSTDGTHWWTAFTSLYKIYWKQQTCRPWEDPRKTKHWSRCSVTQLAFACAYRLDAWAAHLLVSPRPIQDRAQRSHTLCVAAAFGNGQSVASLIDAGADVDYEVAGYGSPLYLSSIYGHDHIVPVLLGHSATVSKGQRYYSPFIAAILCRPLEVVTMLLDHGAVVSERGPNMDKTGHLRAELTALEAAIQRDFKFLEALLPHAVSQGMSVKDYKAAHVLAWSSGRTQHAKCLESKVAQLSPQDSPISLFVRTLNNQTITIGGWSDDLVIDIKERVHLRTCLPTDQLWLFYAGRNLHENRKLHEYGIGHESTIHVLLRCSWAGA